MAEGSRSAWTFLGTLNALLSGRRPTPGPSATREGRASEPQALRRPRRELVERQLGSTCAPSAALAQATQEGIEASRGLPSNDTRCGAALVGTCSIAQRKESQREQLLLDDRMNTGAIRPRVEIKLFEVVIQRGGFSPRWTGRTPRGIELSQCRVCASRWLSDGVRVRLAQVNTAASGATSDSELSGIWHRIFIRRSAGSCVDVPRFTRDVNPSERSKAPLRPGGPHGRGSSRRMASYVRRLQHAGFRLRFGGCLFAVRRRRLLPKLVWIIVPCRTDDTTQREREDSGGGCQPGNAYASQVSEGGAQTW